MSKESYARGFCKVAEAAGVDPVALAKYAQVPPIKGKNETYGPTVRNAESQQMISNLDKDMLKWQQANPPSRLFAERATGLSIPTFRPAPEPKPRRILDVFKKTMTVPNQMTQGLLYRKYLRNFGGHLGR